MTDIYINNEIEQLISNEITQFEKYIILPNNISKFFKGVYLGKTSTLLSSDKDILLAQQKKTEVFNLEIDKKLGSLSDNNIPKMIDIPQKIYKKNKDNKINLEIKTIKISKTELLNYLAEFKSDYDRLINNIITSLDLLKTKILNDKLINLSNLKYFMELLLEINDCHKIKKKSEIKADILNACISCNVIVNNINNIVLFIENIINTVKLDLLDSNKSVKNLFYEYLISKIEDKTISSYDIFIKASYKKVLIYFYYNIFNIIKFKSSGKTQYTFNIENNNILAACTIFVNTVYDLLNQKEYLKKVLKLMNLNNYNLICFKTIFKLFFNIEINANDPLAKFFLYNQMNNELNHFGTLDTNNFDFIDTIYINGSTDYINTFNKMLDNKYTFSNKYNFCKINESYNNISINLFGKLQYLNLQNQINPPIKLSENLFLLIHLMSIFYQTKLRNIEKVSFEEYIKNKEELKCTLSQTKIPPPIAPKPLRLTPSNANMSFA